MKERVKYPLKSDHALLALGDSAPFRLLMEEDTVRYLLGKMSFTFEQVELLKGYHLLCWYNRCFERVIYLLKNSKAEEARLELERPLPIDMLHYMWENLAGKTLSIEEADLMRMRVNEDLDAGSLPTHQDESVVLF